MQLVLHDPGSLPRRCPRAGAKPGARVTLEVLKRDRYTCRICGRSPVTVDGLDLEVDHVQRFSKGGADALANYQTLCQRCNRGKGNREDLNRTLAAEIAVLLDDINPEIRPLIERSGSASVVANNEDYVLDPLRVVYRRALRREEVAVDPTKGLELRRPDGRRERIASPAEAGELLAALDDDYRALWATAFYAGLRRGELRAALERRGPCGAGDPRAARLGCIEGEQEGKSAAANRRVPILDPLARELAALKLRTGRDGATSCSAYRVEAVHAGIAASPDARGVGGRERAAQERATEPEGAELLAPITLHEARHTCASLMIAAGVNAKALAPSWDTRRSR